MKITITKTVSRTYALGNYENYKPTITISEELEVESITPAVYADKLDNLTAILNKELWKEKAKIEKLISKK